MLLFSNPRLYLFNKLDALTGNKRDNHYKDIQHIIEHADTNKTNEYINRLLIHAKATMPFYASYKDANHLEAFPIVDKNSIKKNYVQFQSIPFINQKKIEVRTSGSTGTPFKIFHNKEKRLRNEADNIYFSEKAGYSIGNKLYYFRMWNAFGKKNLLAKWAQNMEPIDVFDLCDTYYNGFIEKLRNNKKTMSWLGYASTFEQLCKYLDKTNAKPIDCNLQSVIAISEGLTAYTKNTLKKYFNADAVSRYSNVENGIIAQQFPKTSFFIVNTASYHVEILDLNMDIPVAHGTKGRIVVTDLFNYCMPMIRYDTGDIGTMGLKDGKLILTEVDGRKFDMITNTKGELIPENLIGLINNYHELNQCQLIQKSANTFVFKINSDGIFKNESKFIAEFKTYLGNDAHIEIEYVNEIPLLASGKRRVIVNEMNL